MSRVSAKHCSTRSATLPRSLRTSRGRRCPDCDVVPSKFVIMVMANGTPFSSYDFTPRSAIFPLAFDTFPSTIPHTNVLISEGILMALNYQQVRQQVKQLGESAPARHRRLQDLRNQAQN